MTYRYLGLKLVVAVAAGLVASAQTQAAGGPGLCVETGIECEINPIRFTPH